jgi:hypothetical protein
MLLLKAQRSAHCANPTARCPNDEWELDTQGGMQVAGVGKVRLITVLVINIYDLITGGMIGGLLLIIAFAVVYVVFLCNPDDSHKKHPP